MAMLPVRRSGGRNLTVVNPTREFEDIYDRMGQLMNLAFGLKGRRHRRARRTGRFEFRTYLPGDVNADGVNAQLSDGVLTVTIPKAEAAKPHHIEISG